jgi:capsid assembly protease
VKKKAMNILTDLNPEHAAAQMWSILPSALAAISPEVHTQLLVEQAMAAQAGSIFAAPPTAAAPKNAGAVAVINVQGVITPRGSWLLRALGLGGGGLMGLREALHEAMTDGDVGSILLNIDSPGGLVDLVPETANEIRESRGDKKIVAIANTCAASAAYYLASQADEVVVTPSGAVGSIGVLLRHEDISGRLEQMGVKITLQTAGKFKGEGNPFQPLSKEAEAARQQQIEDFYGMFVADIAAGRGVSKQAVLSDYGEGRTLLADRALAAGMVDRVETIEETIRRLGGSVEEEGGTEDDDEDENDGDEGPEASTEPPPEADDMSDDQRRQLADFLFS